MANVKYRLELNYLAEDSDTCALETSSPIYTLEEGFRKYFAAIDTETCVDDKTRPVRAHLWKYHWTRDGKCKPETLAKNY